MGKNSDKSNLIGRLRNGEKITCFKCKKGIYVTTEGHIRTANCFWCNNCNSMIESIPADVIVE